MTNIRARARPLTGDDTGTVTSFVVVIATAVVLSAGLVFDGGLALSAKRQATGHAEEAARAGAQAIDLAAYRADGSLRLRAEQARLFARDYLTVAGASGTVAVAGNTVTVTVTATRQAQLLTLAGIDTIKVTATGRARPLRGINNPEP